MQNPTLIATPFAENGDKNTIPESVGAEPQNATMQTGFPPITQEKISAGGIPPERNDFNGILNALSQHTVFLNKGGRYKYDASFAQQIGGYPIEACLLLDGGTEVVSEIDNNTNDPNVNMAGWKNKKEVKASDVLDATGKTQQEINNILLNIVVTPEMFGAKGDGINDDSESIKSWWLSPHVRKSASSKYKINLGEQGVTHNLINSINIDMTGAEFIVTQQARYIFRISCPASNLSIVIKGGRIQCENLIARPLEIQGEAILSNLSVSFNEAYNIKENGQSMSANGLLIGVRSTIVDIHHNIYKNISRITINAGVVACQAINVSRIIGSCFIYSNDIDNVSCPSGAVDADGIVTFSEVRLITPPIVQAVNIRIYNNKIKDCLGRFVKLQSPAKVYLNDFRSENGTLIPEFRCIDALFGGVDVFNNEWRLSSEVEVGSSSLFYYYQGVGGSGSLENVGYCINNKLYLSKSIIYLAHVSLTGGKHSVSVCDNVIKDEDNLVKVMDMVRLSINDASLISKSSLTVSRNKLTLGNSGIVMVTGAGFANLALVGKLSLTVTDNEALGVLVGAKVIENTAEAINPYLSDLLIRNNGSQMLSFNQIAARGVDLSTLRSGSSFFYATDGGAGGLLNAPTGFNRYVFVNSQSGSVELLTRAGDKKAVRGEGVWYQYNGTVIS